VATTFPDDEPALKLSGWNQALLLVVVISSGAAYNAAIFTASAILPQMQGAMSATQDEISWTVTFNILATAIVTPMTGWLVARFGQRNTLIGCLSGFIAATIMCGLSTSLEQMVVWRIVQGAAGAPLLPIGQTLLLDAYPRRQHTMVIALFGMANTIGPVAGPTLGGYLAEHYSWRWSFFMVVPLSAISLIGVLITMPRGRANSSNTLDWTGFLSLSVAIACAQLALSRGPKLDWFQSPEIMLEVFIGLLSFYMFLAHSLTSSRPFLRPALLTDRNYAVGLVLIALFGMLNFTPMVILPPLLQNQMGYPDTVVGTIISWRGIGVATGFCISLLTGRFDARASMVAGFGLQVISGLWMMSINLQFGTSDFIANSILQGLAVGIIWAPIVTVAFATLAPADRSEGVAVFHLMRNIGSSFFIALTVSEIIRTTGANYSRLGEDLSGYNKMLAIPGVAGSWSVDTLQGLAGLSRELDRQASIIGYENAFMMYTVASAFGIPLSLMVSIRSGRKKAP
jgi:DHA2 family multidrug resistance protein